MAIKQIPNLPSVLGLAGPEQFETVQGGLSARTSLSQMTEYIVSRIPPSTGAGGSSIVNLAALKTLLSRPDTVVTQGYATPGDGGGGTWVWAVGDSTPVNDGTNVSPTGLPLGRYKRIYDVAINVRWFGCVCDGVTDDTVNFQKALNVGGEIVVDGDVLLGVVTSSVANTHLRGLKRPRIISLPGTTASTINAQADWFAIDGFYFESLNSPGQWAMLRVGTSNYKIKSCRFQGMSYNPQQFQQALTNCGPHSCIYVGGFGSTPYLLTFNGLMDDVYVSGGNGGIIVQGAARSKFHNITTFYCLGMGMILGGGISAYDVQVSNYLSVGCGLYGFSNSSLFGGASQSEPVPMQNWLLTGMHVEKSGWAAYFIGLDAGGGNVGGTKYGYDLTDNGMMNLRFWGSAMDCAAGGLEDKGGSSTGYDTSLVTSAPTASGTVLTFGVGGVVGIYLKMLVSGTNIPADTYVSSFTTSTVTLTRAVTGAGVAASATINFWVDIQPPGHNDMLIDMSYVSHLDHGQQGVGLYQEDPTIPSGSWTTNHHIRCFAVTEQAPLWRSLHQYRTWDVVASNGGAWLCFGRKPDGATGNSGMTAPSAGGAKVSLVANGTTPSGTVIPVTSTAGAVVGMWVFANNVLGGTTITAINPGVSITLSQAVVDSGVLTGKALIVGTMHDDDSLLWFWMMNDTSGTAVNNQAVGGYGVKNATIEIDCVGQGRALDINVTGGNDDKYINLKATVKARECANGVAIGGVGSLINATFVDCDVEARSTAFSMSATGTNDWLISGGRFMTYGVASQQSFRINAGTNTVRLDGGVVFASQQYAAYITAGTNTIKCGAVTFEGAADSGNVVQLRDSSAGTWDWGNAIMINNNAVNAPGWQLVAPSTMTTRGRVLRQDMTAAPIATTRANVGEYMVLATPTATEWGYFCQAVTTPFTAMVWKKLPLT